MKLPPGFDLGSIEVFLLTAELGGMTQSAQHLGMTQSAVSQAVSRLETALGARLFDRALRPLALTPAGKLLLHDGAQLLASAKGLAREVREGSRRPYDCVTLAMAESVANHVTAPLLRDLGGRAARWELRSGISLLHHHDFVARKIDMLVTGSSRLEDAADIEHHSVLGEEFILIAPGDYAGTMDPTGRLCDLPFIRYSRLSSMGQQIERQVARMRLPVSHTVEMDSTMQQLSTVAAGGGWSISTPLCVASHLDHLPHLRVAPMERAQFGRRVQVLARRGEFGSLPQDIAALARRSLRDGRLAELVRAVPWIAEKLSWAGE